MNKKRNTYVLIATILNGLELGLFGLLALAIVTLRNAPSFREGFEDGYSDSVNINLYSDNLINIFAIIFTVIAIYALIKFILGLIGYTRNNHNLVLVSAIISSVGGMLFLFTFSPFVIFEIIIAVLMFIGFSKMKATPSISNNYDQNNKTNGVEL